MNKSEKSEIQSCQEKEAVLHGLLAMVNTNGWDTVKELILDETSVLDTKIKRSESLEEVFSCTKRRFGILFILEEVERLIQDGKDAVDRLNSFRT